MNQQLHENVSNRLRNLNASLTLPDGSGYLVPPEAKEAVQFAWGCNRPLLVLGEAGVGKTDLARAIAHTLDWELLVHTMLSTSTAQDLLWTVDHVKRLAAAQISEGGRRNARDLRRLSVKNFITKGVLYQALGAGDNAREAPAVVLIDEIDKAPHDVPNNLLDVLDNGSFMGPDGSEFVAKSDAPQNLVILTSNREKSLPKAFLRRCVVLLIEVNEANYQEWLVERGKIHLAKTTPDLGVLNEAAAAVVAHRQQAGRYKSGTSEFLDLVKAAQAHAPSKITEQIELVQQFAKYIRKDVALIG